MTLIAGLSAYAGLKRGVRVLSILDFSVMSCILIMVLLADKTSFLLNLFVQSIGYHIQHTTDLSFHTDAFEQLGTHVFALACFCGGVLAVLVVVCVVVCVFGAW